MNTKLYSLMLILFLSVGATSFGQSRGQGRGPVGGPPAGIGNSQVQHGDHGQANKPSESNKSTSSPRNDVSARLSEDTALTSKLQGMLPAGTNMQTAASGFKNVGQFVAAVHVSKNMNIPFDQLKGAVLTNHRSLGDAIHDLKPEITTDAAKAEAKKAEEQAKEDSKKIS